MNNLLIWFLLFGFGGNRCSCCKENDHKKDCDSKRDDRHKNDRGSRNDCGRDKDDCGCNTFSNSGFPAFRQEDGDCDCCCDK